ncbi:MAG: hypothetical protein MJ202_01350 [Lentisphaeria bacterium]|nr:hypothetical protein [Lentisphaeria bacterium]
MAVEMIKCPHCECKVKVADVEKEDGYCPECGQLVMASSLQDDFDNEVDDDEFQEMDSEYAAEEEDNWNDDDDEMEPDILDELNDDDDEPLDDEGMPTKKRRRSSSSGSMSYHPAKNSGSGSKRGKKK